MSATVLNIGVAAAIVLNVVSLALGLHTRRILRGDERGATR